MRSFLYLAVLVGAGVLCFAIYAYDYYSAPGPLTAQTTVLLPRGERFREITFDLAKQGAIEEPLLFETIAVVTGGARNFKAGEYSFPAGATPHVIMSMIAEGKVVVHKVTVPEGWNVREITALLMKEDALEGDVPSDIKEGTLMPETYHFMRGDKRADVIARMQAGMQSTIESLWPKRKVNAVINTPEEALTLASIVEKETGLVAERPHVASVFLNRLRLGMRLQSDPTVVYGLEKDRHAALGRSLTSADLQSQTPYNTYVIDKLPPGPIACPGRAAIEAVLNAPDTDDLYFVATGSGGHNFAATLEQHNHNVALYRVKMAKQ